MSDLINRQDAINAIKNDLSPIINTYDLYRVLKMACIDRAVRQVEQVPSVQPEQPEWVQTVERWYNKALCKPEIKKPMAWALYQTWKEYDNG